MTTAAIRTPEQVARSIFDAVAARDPAAIAAHGAPEVFDDFVAIGTLQGPAAVRAFFEEVFAAFPDFAMTVKRVVADDTSAVVQWEATGTFSGSPFQGVAATGKRVHLKGVDVMEISDGLLRRNTIYYDGATFARQVGLLPGQGSTGDRLLLGAFNLKTRAAGLTRRARRG
jgi:steroid delta-isomerase-like uncharacterized protein